MKMRHLLWLPVCCLLLCACGGAQQQNNTLQKGEMAFETIEWQEEPDQTFQQLVSDIRYVPLESTPESFLTDIVKVLVRGDEIYVIDREDAAPRYGGIRVFGTDGRYRRHIGREGKGPGELLNLTDFTIRDSLLFAVDTKSDKLVVYTLAGDFVEQLPVPESAIASCAACNDGLLWSGDIYYKEIPQDRYGLYRTDDRGNLLWKAKLYGEQATRALIAESSDSLFVWRKECCDSIYLYDRRGEVVGGIRFNFPEKYRIPYDQRLEVKSKSHREDFGYYEFDMPLVVGPYLLGLVSQPQDDWINVAADRRTGKVYIDDNDHNLIRARVMGGYALSDSTFVTWITPDSEAVLAKKNPEAAAALPDDVRQRIDDGDCVLVFYTLKL